LPRQSRGPPRNSQSEGEGKGKVGGKTNCGILFLCFPSAVCKLC
jgi:hypothetical protein